MKNKSGYSLFSGICIFIVLFLLSPALKAEISVASILGDNMVLQQNSTVKLWGTADAGKSLTVEVSWSGQKLKTNSNADGKWVVTVPTTKAGGPYSISVYSGNEKLTLNNILLGEVWLCSGQSNMQMTFQGYGDQPVLGANDFLMDAANDQIRLFTVGRNSIDSPQDTCAGSWAEASAASVKQFSAVGYLYAKILQKKLGVPIGVICSSWGGSRIESWMQEDVIKTYGDNYSQTTQENTPSHHRAARLFNGMIAPLQNMAIKGAIWYQGESNVYNFRNYAALMAGMVNNWRELFACGEFSFYYVEIAPWGGYPINSALQREAQLKAMSLIPNSGMACTIDVGEDLCIHPADKLTVAKRLAYWALAETYGFEGVECRPAVYKELQIQDSLAIVSFDHIGNGLSTMGKAVECFEIAGEDQVFYPAQMSVSQKKVSVWSSQVKKPVAVRYAFSNFPKSEGFLYNMFGLPVPSFRTDNWEK